MEGANDSLQHEDLLISLRSRLNTERIKLWEPPYSEEPCALRELAQKYSESLQRDSEAVFLALLELQQHAASRALANAQFKQSGLATLRVRASVPGDRLHTFNVQRQLDSSGAELVADVAREIPVSDTRIKLIVNGKVVDPTKTLQEQGIKNGIQILALIMAESAEQMRLEDGVYKEMQATREDAALLSQADADVFQSDTEYMKLEDQYGNVVKLPAAERRALMVGLALHEHGRTAARNRDYRLALVLLLEADRHFSECNSAVLSTVDNWALLQLDVAWCYLCLQSLSAAADAAQRLQRAEQFLQKSYGPNMERLIALKGTDAAERTLIMRLHLLQAIVSYHQNQRARARQLIEKAESELNELRVDENGVVALVELGWSRGQARTGLRAAGGSPDAAHHYLNDLQEQRRKARVDAKSQRLQQSLSVCVDEQRVCAEFVKLRLQQSLGVCVDGQRVSAEFVKLLVGMGYPRPLAVAALQNSNNHVSDAVRIIQEQPELLASAVTTSESFSSLDSVDGAVIADEDLVTQLAGMGYEVRTAAVALQQTNNDAEAAVDLLARSGGLDTFAVAPNASGGEEAGAAGASTSAADSHSRHRMERDIQAELKRRAAREAALGRLQGAIATSEDDHLDTSLQEEEGYLAQYKSLLM